MNEKMSLNEVLDALLVERSKNLERNAEIDAELASLRDKLPRLRRARKPKANGKPKRTRQPKPAPAPEPPREGER